MDAKDLRIELALGAHTNDGSTKYAQSGPAPNTNGNKPYHDIGPNAMAKVDVPTARPCAIIGPDRVVPPHSTTDLHNVKKAPVEPWPCSNNLYRHPPDYPHKTADYHPPGNISPRQTFQENMPRIMVPPIYASKGNEDHSLKNQRHAPEVKYCEVPYTISPVTSEPKVIKSSEMPVPNNNLTFAQTIPPQGWPGSGVNMRPMRPYGAPELYQYPEYASCPGSRPVSMIRPHRNVHEDVPQIYPERFYHEANARFKPYPNTKERHSQVRYDYMSNYPNSFHPPAAFPPHKYDLQKSIPPHYSVYPPLSLKYVDRRMPAPTLERYRRSPNPQTNFNAPFVNQNIPPAYGSVPGNCLPNRTYPYAPDSATKNMMQNKFYIDNSNARKYYPGAENMFLNDINRPPNIKNDAVYSPYPSINIHSLPPHHMYRKEALMKNYEQHYRNFDYTANVNALPRLQFQFSPQTVAISPCDSNISNDTTTLGLGQEDCGYVSQSSTASVRSIESAVNRISNDMFRRQDIRSENPLLLAKSGQKETTESSKDKKGLNVRQFLQMWNEGDDEPNDSNKEAMLHKDCNKTIGHYETHNTQEQLYVLDLVNVPNHELGKYDHIQKISKLPENIKGYNNIEILNQYEKLVESPNLNEFTLAHPQQKKGNLQVQTKNSINKQGVEMLTRPISPLDVEAKISQSVIHKEVRCNFEIKPCSPQMLNVDIATPVQNVLGERLIEKVVNPVISKTPIIQRLDDVSIDTSLRNSPKVPSCKMVNIQYPSPNINESKTNYSIQDLESNSGVCLSSLPRLDNDIELSFPEINQQFINANKIESSVPFMRELLDPDNADNRPLSRDKVQKPFIMDQVPSGSESDKEFVKLSKYRKQKRSTSDSKEHDNKTNPIAASLNRTDSVIIKNPDNIKSQEEYFDNQNLPINMKSFNNSVLNPVNLIRVNCTENYCKDKYAEEIINDCTSGDIAIDFRLNKGTDEQINRINGKKDVDDTILNHFVTEGNIPDDFNNLKPDNKQSAAYSISMPNLNSISASSLNDITSAEEINICDISPDSKCINKKNNINLEEDTNTVEHRRKEEQDVPEDDTVCPHLKLDKTIADKLTELVKEELITQINLPTSSYKSTESSENTNGSNICSDLDGSTISNNTVLNNDSENILQNHSSIADFTDSVLNTDNITGEHCNNSNSEIVSSKTKQGIESYVIYNDADTDIPEIICSKSPEVNSPVCMDHKIYDELKIKNVASEEIHEIQCNEIILGLHSSKNDIRSKTPKHESESSILVIQEYKELNSSDVDCIHNFDTTKNLEINHLSSYNTSSSHIIEIVPEVEINLAKNILVNVDVDEAQMDCTANKLSCNTKDKDKSEICLTDQFTNSVKSSPLDTLETNDCMTNNYSDHENENCIDQDGNHTDHENDNHTDHENDNHTDHENNNYIDHENDNYIDHVNGDHTDHENDSHTDYENDKHTDHENYSHTDHDNGSHIDHENDNHIDHITKQILNYREEAELKIPYDKKCDISSMDGTDGNVHRFNCNRYKNGSYVRKELFSPWIQKLLIYNEGLCLKGSDRKEKFTEICDTDNTKNNFQETEEYNVMLNAKTVKERVEENTNVNLIMRDSEASKFVIFLNKCENNGDSVQISASKDENLKENETESIKEKKYVESESAKNNIVESLMVLTEDQINENNEAVENNMQINVELNDIFDEKPLIPENVSKTHFTNRHSRILKRSLSESAAYNPFTNSKEEDFENNFMYSNKRKKNYDPDILVESQFIAQNLNNFIQNNRRNSISTIYNDNVSFCIVIDNDCVVTDESDDTQKFCFTQVTDDCLSTVCTEEALVSTDTTEGISYQEENCEYNHDIILHNEENKSIEETWIEDVACMETVFSDDIAEDIIISAPISPKESETSDDEIHNSESVYIHNVNEHSDKIKCIYGEQMSDDDAQLVEKLYRTPQMDVNKTLIDNESQVMVECDRYYDKDSLEKVLSGSKSPGTNSANVDESVTNNSMLALPCNDNNYDIRGNKENLHVAALFPVNQTNDPEASPTSKATSEFDKKFSEGIESYEFNNHAYSIVDPCESSCVNCSCYNNNEEKMRYAVSSSPEVSSTTTEERNSGILLKIKNYKGTKISEINEMGAEHRNMSGVNNGLTTSTYRFPRPLITKAAQKYIPPLKETLRDLKVKLRLPQQSLYKLKQLKKSKEEPKIKTSHCKHKIESLTREKPKKVKPKFEDVLMSIDEIQFKMHKEKSKKVKHSIPKVIIKKNENGAHYASTQSKETFNPDLTGRKWQPWVFLEKNDFIDKMALKQKFKAIYSHRKKTYVLAESFRKYKSINSAKFVITHPKENVSTGKLKYTIRLKHN